MRRIRFVVFIATVLAAAPVFAQRLPGGVVPTHYDITVEPNLAEATFAAAEKIAVDVARPTRSIVLNAAEITFDLVAVTAGGRTQTATATANPATEQVTFTVARPVPAGAATIDIKYRGILNDELRGLYLSKANNRRYAVTQMEATDARRMFPSFDEPAYKATFSLTAIIDDGDHAISNGAVISDTPGPRPGKHTVAFAPSPKMSSYLVALAVGDFECRAGAAEGTPIRICSTPDKKALTGFALESAQQILRYYNRYYGVKYPFTKLDVVAVPDFAAGAMENVGAIFYRESYLLADPDDASIEVQKRVAVVLAHEMAHQWFGDLVTMKWWDDLWLNEGFANWMETKPVAEWKPEWHLELDEVLGNQSAMSLDALRATRAIRARASTPAEINELFDGITYAKGAAVVRMVERWVGEAPFRAGVNAYINKFQYGNARAEDFWTTLTAVTGKPVDKVMKTFVDQPGVPIVDARLDCAAAGARVVLSQARYSRDRSAPAPAALWNIPVCVKSTAGTTCTVLSQQSSAVALDSCPPWVLTNASGRGYYRMGYTPELLRALATHVASLEPAERLALLDDEWAMVRAGRHDVGAFLDLASGFGGERNGAVLAALAGTLEVIGEELTTAATRDTYRAWVSTLLSPALAEFGWMPRTAEAPDTRAARAAVIGALGVTARDRNVEARARELALEELRTPGTVPPELRDVVVGLAARGGDAPLYDRFLARARDARDPEEQTRYWNALTRFSDPALARRTMELILGPDVRSQDAKILIAGMLVNPDIQAVAWDLLKARWDEVQKKTGESVGNTIIVGALAAFCDAKFPADATRFFASHPVPDAGRTLQQSLERINACAALQSVQAPKLAAWLDAAVSR